MNKFSTNQANRKSVHIHPQTPHFYPLALTAGNAVSRMGVIGLSPDFVPTKQ
jgi:hypothetical protein